MSEKFEEKWPEMRMKHLELIQSVVSRMGNHSANLKNYCMALIAGLLGLAAASGNPKIVIFASPIIFIFAFLDANYLMLERGFRSQYDVLRKQPIDKEPDFLITTGWSVGHSWFETFFSWSVIGFYAPILVIMFIIYFFI